jgi:hypothetical protein
LKKEASKFASLDKYEVEEDTSALPRRKPMTYEP